MPGEAKTVLILETLLKTPGRILFELSENKRSAVVLWLLALGLLAWRSTAWSSEVWQAECSC